MHTARNLRKRAEHFRRMWRLIIDPVAARAIEEMADELDMTAQELERRQLIRERAHAMWVQHDHPAKRDVEFWLAAEREVDIPR